MMNPNGSSLNGTLRDFKPVELIQAIGYAGTTGALHITVNGNKRGIMYFDKGSLTWCRDYDPRALTLGDVLQQLRRVTTQDIIATRKNQLDDPLGAPLGERLVQDRKITPEQLTEALQMQILWTIREMAVLQQGEYIFNANETAPAHVISLPIDASRVTMEIVRYQHEWNELEQWLPYGMHTPLQMVTEVQGTHPLLFHAASWRLIIRVNTYRTPRQIATHLREPEMDVARNLVPLIRDGFLSYYVSDRPVPRAEDRIAGTPVQGDPMGLLYLIQKMEQDWDKRSAQFDRLVALATFINWTIDALTRILRERQMSLPQHQLRQLLERENLSAINYIDSRGTPQSYQMAIRDNHIDIAALSTFMGSLLGNTRPNRLLPPTFPLDSLFMTLSRALVTVLNVINLRIESSDDRASFESTWTTMLQTFYNQLHESESGRRN